LNKKYKGTIKVMYSFFNQNTGTSKGHNLLAKGCKSDFLFLMNPDLLFSSNFVQEILEPILDNKKIGIVEGRQSPLEHSKEFDKKTGETSWSSGACTLIKNELFQEIHGYDERSFFLYCDDVDLSWRVRLKGYIVFYQPMAIVYHAKRLSNSGKWLPSTAEKYYSAEAALIMAYKWSNPDRVKYLLKVFSDSTDENLQKAAKEFKRKKDQNELPEQIDKNHQVATFEGDYYAKPRYIF
jgi:GT2 family glycosyltransferase